MAAKLKVFTWSDGFHAFTVATGSRPKALAAWGVGQDLFKSGLACEAPDGPDRDAALAAPGAVISRGLAIDVGKITRARPRPTNAAAVKRLKALEAELDALDADQARETEKLDARKAALEQEAADQITAHGKARDALMARVTTARKAVG